MTNHRTEQTVLDVHPIESPQYCAGLRVRDIEKAAIEKVLCKNHIKPAPSKMSIAHRICPKEGRFATMVYRQQKAERFDRQGRPRNQANGIVFGLLAEAKTFSTLEANLDTAKSKSTTRTRTNRRLRRLPEGTDFYECCLVWRTHGARSSA